MFKSGSWNAICDVCGFKFKSHQIKKRWDGLMVCENDYEQDHPQKFLRVQSDKIAPDWVRPRPEDVFVPKCDLWTSNGVVDMCTVDCAIVDKPADMELLIAVYYPSTSAIADIAVADMAISDVRS